MKSLRISCQLFLYHTRACVYAICRFLLTRPLRDVTGWFVLASLIINISTHTPLAGRDDFRVDSIFWRLREFLLTRPLRDVTHVLLDQSV